jgi:hypothetical protein
MLSATWGGMTISKETSSRSGPSGRKRALDAVASTETSMTPDLLRLVSVLREQMHATLSRSDALKPLAWLIVIIMTTAVTLVYATAPEWLLICLPAECSDHAVLRRVQLLPRQGSRCPSFGNLFSP